MNYKSTRGKAAEVEAAQAIVKGIAEDGGLFVPETIPAISKADFDAMINEDYRTRAEKIFAMYLTDFTAEEIKDCVNKAYSIEKFGSDNAAPIHKLDDDKYILELWHGPTCAFKDMALQILPHLLTKSMKKTGVDKEVVILVATSGDTGKAALEGFCDVEGTKIMVFFPNDGVSNIQKLQMVTQKGENVNVMSVFGNFDDAQNGVKQIFGDKDFAEKIAEKGYQLSSANSINWGRLLPQIVYYVSAYCDMVKMGDISFGEKVNVCVPTGNFGNILAAWYAKAMGLPIGKLICASNENNVLTDFINDGIYDRNRNFKTTISPSMDILISSNLERLLYNLSDAETVAGYMQQLKETGKYEVSSEIRKAVSDLFEAGYVDDKQTKAEIKKIWEKYGYLIDTHTAVAVAVNEKLSDGTKTIIASTANPFKFNGSVYEALSGNADIADEFEILDRLSAMTENEVPASLAELKTKAPRFNSCCKKEDMENCVAEFLA
ncbi:MAG: threonine synthase [Clostridia bacterium]|nr:threonine synthase [Clostridia bacterium]